MQIDFTPHGAFRFFGRMVKDLSDRCLSIEDLQEPGLDRLRERLAEIRDWPRLLDLSEHFVRGGLHKGIAGHPAVDWALDRLVVSGGGTPISHLAQDIGWSRRHLIARFREQVGAAAQAARPHRPLRDGLTRVRASPQLGWADVALTCGYSDQAQLIRDFSKFCGLTPTIWMQSIRTDQQRSG